MGSSMVPGKYKKIGIATIIMMVSIFLSRVTGLAREMVLAAVSGAGTAVDAYRVAFVLPEILNHILASGFLSVTFIPIFTRALSHGDEKEGWRIFSIILTVFGTLLTILILIGMLLAPTIVPLLAPGRNDPQFLEMAVRMTRITLPAQLFFFAGGMLMAVQYAKERFLIPALAPLVYNMGIIAGGWFLGRRFGVEGFCWGALAGAFTGSFAIQLLGARAVGMKFRPAVDLRHTDLRRYALLTLPLMLGLTMVFSTELFSKFFGSFLPAGAIAWIDYAMRVMLLMVAFFGQAVGVASYPYMAQMAVQGRLTELNEIINKALGYLSMLIPISILIMVLRHEIIHVLFERGQFTPRDTTMTAMALSGLMIGAFAFAAQTVVNRGFYATQNTFLPAAYGTLAVFVSLPVYWIGLNTWGVLGMGGAISVSAMIQTFFLFAIWNRRSNNTAARKVYRSFLGAFAAAVVMGGPLWLLHQKLVAALPPNTKVASLAIIGAVSGSFVLLVGLWGWFFKIEAVHYLVGQILSRCRRAAG
jgi:putative peptidoglycan lipid II flippase